ncbi:MAG: GNAT family N-acetyltransferase [Pseudolysinimonas sp.]|uniref:GNAT family N-acetyltransferase n=1 Tax=Pseudolysinimonas sp. TaxID=2680009 RepID=UPI003C73C982
MIELREVSWDHPDGDRLRADQQAELAVRYGRLDSEPGPKPSADDMSIFFVAYDGTEAVGCGGLRTLDERHGEIKRMYVVPERRGTGVARAILRHLEVEARSRGWDRLVLETGDEQPDAMRFYEREGYTPIPNFGYYADSELSRCYAKAL